MSDQQEQTWKERWAWLNRAGVPGLPGFSTAEAAIEDMRRKLQEPTATLDRIEYIGFRLCLVEITAKITRIVTAHQAEP